MSAVVAVVRYSGQPINVFSIFIEWDGFAKLKQNEQGGSFKILRAYEYDKSREPRFYEAVAMGSARYKEDRKARFTPDINKSLKLIDNILVPIYK